MNTTLRLFFISLALFAFPMSYTNGAELDRAAVDYKLPGDIKLSRNAAGTNEQTVLFGDPNKPGPYVVRLKWLPGNMSRPHFHPNDRYIAVLSGTWWVGS